MTAHTEKRLPAGSPAPTAPSRGKRARSRTAAFLLAPAALVLLCCLAGCGAESPFEKQTYVMGTVAWVKIYGLEGRAAAEAAEEALEEMHRIESVMSAWKEESELSRLNAASGGAPRELSDELFDVVDRSFRFSRITGGAFDPTTAPLVDLWGFRGGEPALPGDAALDSALALVGSSRIVLDREEQTIALLPGMRLDLGGIAKGYAVDRAAEILRGRGAQSALVNIGGNMYAIGAPPGRDAWTIGIRDPRGGDGVAGTLLLRNEAVATSGDYENFVEIDGRRYGHIIDPRSGRPAAGVLAVTVVARTAIAADALSTGLFVMGPERAPIALAAERARALFALPGEGDEVRFLPLGDFAGSLDLDRR